MTKHSLPVQVLQVAAGCLDDVLPGGRVDGSASCRLLRLVPRLVDATHRRLPSSDALELAEEHWTFLDPIGRQHTDKHSTGAPLHRMSTLS